MRCDPSTTSTTTTSTSTSTTTSTPPCVPPASDAVAGGRYFRATLRVSAFLQASLRAQNESQYLDLSFVEPALTPLLGLIDASLVDFFTSTSLSFEAVYLGLSLDIAAEVRLDLEYSLLQLPRVQGFFSLAPVGVQFRIPNVPVQGAPDGAKLNFNAALSAVDLTFELNSLCEAE